MRTLLIAMLAIFGLVAAPRAAAASCSATENYELLNLMNGQPHTQEGLDDVRETVQDLCTYNDYIEIAQAVMNHFWELRDNCGFFEECNYVDLMWDSYWWYFATHAGG